MSAVGVRWVGTTSTSPVQTQSTKLLRIPTERGQLQYLEHEGTSTQNTEHKTQNPLRYTSENLLVRPSHTPTGQFLSITPESAGWEHIHFDAIRMKAGESMEFASPEAEVGLVMLSGVVDVKSNRGEWTDIGERMSVFEGLPHALYLPRATSFVVTAQSDTEFVVTHVKTDQDREPVRVRPEDVTVEIRGGDNATRQINGIFPPGFACDRLVIVEVYTPSGGWSSYPPHKHDVHREDDEGNILEADLEEVYFYKIDPSDGYAYQRVYTDENSPLHAAGHPINVVVMARENEAILVPEGYHPVVSAPGYTTYYLNVLAGSAQSLANVDDPQFAWVKDSYRTRNPAIPVYDVSGAMSVDTG